VTTPVTVSVRDGAGEDVEALAAAHRLGHEATASARGGALDIVLRGRAEPIEDTFADDLGQPGRFVLIGTANDQFAGYAVAHVVALRSGGPILQIVDLWVHPEARGIGVGSALMQRSLTIAADAGCTGIDARALPGDRATKNFFESFGLVARTIEVHRSL